MPETDVEKAIKTGERLRNAIKGICLEVGEISICFTISTGGAVVCEHDASFETLLQRADEALYRAKAGGQNRVEVA